MRTTSGRGRTVAPARRDRACLDVPPISPARIMVGASLTLQLLSRWSSFRLAVDFPPILHHLDDRSIPRLHRGEASVPHLTRRVIVRQILAGQLVVFTGKLSSLGRKDARAAGRTRLGGPHQRRRQREDDDAGHRRGGLRAGGDGGHGRGDQTGHDADQRRVCCPGTGGGRRDAQAVRDKSNKLKRAEELNERRGSAIQIITEEEFCRLAGVPTPGTLKQQYHALRDVIARYRSLREDHLRYLVKCGVLRPVVRTNADTFFEFPDLAVIRQANEGLAQGAPFRKRRAHAGRRTAGTARVRLPARRRAGQDPDTAPAGRAAETRSAARRATMQRLPKNTSAPPPRSTKATIRRRKKRQPPIARRSSSTRFLVPALINLANIHYSRDETVEAQALYTQAIGLEPDFFEAHFNLGNIYHDLGRFPTRSVLSRGPSTQPDLRRRPLLPRGEVREDGPVAGRPAALARLSAARAGRRVGRACEGVLGLKSSFEPKPEASGVSTHSRPDCVSSASVEA